MGSKQAGGRDALMARHPWLLPGTLLVLLALLSLLLPRPPRPVQAVADDAAPVLESLGGIEPDPANPVRSLLRIQWNTFPGAQAYEVRFWSHEMREVARHGLGPTNALLLDLEEVWRPVAPARVVHWRVVALEDGADVAASELRTLRLP